MVLTRRGKIRRRKEERLRRLDERLIKLKLAYEAVLAREAAAGRPGRVFRESRDDRSIYRTVSGPEDGSVPRMRWWDNHQFMIGWRPNRRRTAHTRRWRSWQCYAFACVVCNYENRDRWREGCLD